MPTSLRDRAAANPGATFQVIVQASDPTQAGKLVTALENAKKQKPGRAKGLKQKHGLIPTVTAEITGAQLADLASADGVIAVTEDTPIKASGYGNPQTWAGTVKPQWGGLPRGVANPPTIAIVDSGVQSRGDFGARLLTQVNFSSAPARTRAVTVSATARSSRGSLPAAATATRA